MDIAKKYPSESGWHIFSDKLGQFISYASNEGCSSVTDMAKLQIRENFEGSFPDVYVAVTFFCACRQ